MWGNCVSFRFFDKPKFDIKSFDEFFKIVQKNTGFFVGKEDGLSYPYSLFEQQKTWLSLFDEEKPQRRALLASRDKGKSEVVTILGSAWQLFQKPSTRIGVMSFKYENAEKSVHQIVKVLDSVGVSLKHRSGGWYSSVQEHRTPNLMPLGLMSNVRGMHFDYLIMDDPLTINEQFSKKYIDRSRFFLEEGASIAKKIILIGQLLTRNDLYYDAYGNSTGSYYVLQSWHGDIPELDRDIDYLKASMNNKELARNYLGYIDDKEEAIFQSIQFETTSRDKMGQCYAFIDPSAKGKDYTAVCLGYFFEGRIVIYGKMFKAHWAACLDAIIKTISVASRVYYEDNQGRNLGTMLRNAGVMRVMALTTTANKIAKIYSLRGLILADRLRLSNDMGHEEVDQIKYWTETAEYDDLPDCMAMLVQRMDWVLKERRRDYSYYD